MPYSSTKNKWLGDLRRRFKGIPTPEDADMVFDLLYKHGQKGGESSAHFIPSTTTIRHWLEAFKFGDGAFVYPPSLLSAIVMTKKVSGQEYLTLPVIKEFWPQTREFLIQKGLVSNPFEGENGQFFRGISLDGNHPVCYTENKD